MLKRIVESVKKKWSPASESASATSAEASAAPETKSPTRIREVWVPGQGETAPTGAAKPSSDRPPRRRRATPAKSDHARAASSPPATEPKADTKSDRASTNRRSDVNEAASDESAPPQRRRRSRGGRGRRGKRPQTDSAAAQPATDSAPTAPAAEKSPPPVYSTPRPKNIAEFDGQLTFADMDIADPIKQALAEMHFTVTTPIQASLLPIALAGRDAAGKAQTGTGKTAAFLIAIFNQFLRNPLAGDRPAGTPRALILAPTRELALQIQQDALDIGRHTGCTSVAVYGGMDYTKQERQLEQPVDIIVATPGRLLDFAQRKVLHLKKVETLVIDEADRMLDMGFIPDVRKIVRMTPHPEQRQTLLFSATLTPNIVRLAEQWTRKAETVEIEPERIAAESVNQRVFITTQEEKFTLLLNLLWQEKPERVLIFSNRRDQAELLHNHLQSYGFSTALLSGAVDQKKRVRVLDDFKAGKVDVLVATDVAGRGLHVEGISHVINYHMPVDPDDYVHRIGRTGRAGEEGTSISFACELDSFVIPDVEAFIGHSLPCEHPDETLLKPLPPPQFKVAPPKRPARSGGGGNNRGRPRRPRRR